MRRSCRPGRIWKCRVREGLRGIFGLELERLIEISQGLGKEFANILDHAAVLIGIGELDRCEARSSRSFKAASSLPS